MTLQFLIDFFSPFRKLNDAIYAALVIIFISILASSLFYLSLTSDIFRSIIAAQESYKQI